MGCWCSSRDLSHGGLHPLVGGGGVGSMRAAAGRGAVAVDP